ncbi:MAG: SGNH/GDSL hydrolase family protein [Hyphomicrobiales bacterium]
MTQDGNTPDGRPANRFERHPVLTALVLCGLLVLALLFVTESMLAPDPAKAARPGATVSLHQHRGLIVREWQPNRRHRFGTPSARRTGSDEPVKDWYALDMDPSGFIEPSFIHDRPDLEIAFVGGSTTECLYMEPEERFPYLAGRLIEQRTGLRINSLNAGKSGNTSMHSLIAYLGKIAPLKPRYAVLLNALNDIGVLGSHGTYWNTDRTYGILRERERSAGRLFEDLRAVTFPYTFEVLARGWKALKTLVQRGFAAGAQDAGTPPSGGAGNREPAFAAQYEASLRSFVRLVKAWGSAPVLMTQVLVLPGDAQGHPGLLSREELERGKLDMPELYRLQLYANVLIREVARQEGALLVDLANARQWRNRADVYDGLHFTAMGSRRVAEIIADALLRDMERHPD